MDTPLDIDLEVKKINDDLNHIMKLISQRYNLRYYLLMYRLIKKGYVKMSQLCECTGLARTTIEGHIDAMEDMLREKKITHA